MFLPKAGEIIIWHGNLLHGGSKVLDNSLTRLSQVTHYFFEGCAYMTPIFDTINNKNNLLKWRKPYNLLKSTNYKEYEN